MAKPVQDMGASVRARLLKIAKDRNQTFDLLLTRYVLERLLYRLSTTKHRDRFVLKGAMLMTAWFDDPLRPTRDIDFLGFGNAEPQAMIAVFKEVCKVKQDDGVLFDADAFVVDRNREELEYGGLRIKTNATVGGARVRVVIDIGFGDAVEAAEIELPVLLDLPKPKLQPALVDRGTSEPDLACRLGRREPRVDQFEGGIQFLGISAGGRPGLRPTPAAPRAGRAAADRARHHARPSHEPHHARFTPISTPVSRERDRRNILGLSSGCHHRRAQSRRLSPYGVALAVRALNPDPL